LKNLKLLVTVAASFLMSGLFTEAAQTSGELGVSLMRQLYVQDQRDRGVVLSDSGGSLPPNSTSKAPEQLDAVTLQKRDGERRQQVRQLMSSGGLVTAQDFHDAAFIFQHGQEARDYLLAHILAVEAVVKGDASSKWISAATLDRYLQAIGQPQVFGTQYSDSDFAFIVQHRDDPAAIKAHKHEPGMSQQPYDANLMPDALRLSFCVPNRAQQDVNLKEFESGVYPSGILPPGCTR
jgi:hypothetical protein